MFFLLFHNVDHSISCFSPTKKFGILCNDHELQSLIDNPFIMKQRRPGDAQPIAYSFFMLYKQTSIAGPVTFRHWKIQRLSISAIPCEFPYHAYDILIIKFKSFLNPLRALYALNKLFAFNNGIQIVNCVLIQWGSKSCAAKCCNNHFCNWETHISCMFFSVIRLFDVIVES